LVVDDFGVKYHHPSDFAYLVSCLNLISRQSSPYRFIFPWFLSVSQPLFPHFHRLLSRLCFHPSHPPPTFRHHPHFLPFHLHPSLIWLRCPSMPNHPRQLPPRHSLPGQRIANSHWLFALLWSGSGCPRPPRHMCPGFGTSLPYRRNHCPSRPPPRLHCSPPQRSKNLPRLRHGVALLFRRLIPVPTPRRQCCRRPSLPRGPS
jgi:hypothetical protein